MRLVFSTQSSGRSTFERFRPLTEPLRLSAPLVRVDTTTPVDVDDVIARLAVVNGA